MSILSEDGHGEQILQLIFDDGSRILSDHRHHQRQHNNVTFSNVGRDPNLPISDFYEINRIVQEIKSIAVKKLQHDGDNDDTYTIRVAIQFPDELLIDSPDVCWEYEIALPNALIFVLGDSTYAPCCPDVLGAAHLNADCIVHYGHACFQPCYNIPVLYSFGCNYSNSIGKEIITACTDDILNQIKNECCQSMDRILLLYDVSHHNIIKPINHNLTDRSNLSVVVANLPNCKSPYPTTNNIEIDDVLMFGGLSIPSNFDFSNYVLIYIGDDNNRQYINIVLRLLSSSDKIPKQFWTWNPARFLQERKQILHQPSDDDIHNKSFLTCEISNTFQRKLSRRYYMIQKAKQCSVFGILVANLTDLYIRTVVQSLRHMIEYDQPESHQFNKRRSGRACYTFVVGKINVAKLSNFSEIDCFVLVACTEHSLLDDEKEYAVPIITPLELLFALGMAEWGSIDYSLDVKDFLSLYAKQRAVPNAAGDDHHEEEEDDDDTPYFSLITGTLESRKNNRTKLDDELHSSQRDNPGHLIKYESAASNHLKHREYQGLELMQYTSNNEANIQVATIGQTGIASNYESR
jgi:diphthamide biosynthesis protein 2